MAQVAAVVDCMPLEGAVWEVMAAGSEVRLPAGTAPATAAQGVTDRNSPEGEIMATIPSQPNPAGFWFWSTAVRPRTIFRAARSSSADRLTAQVEEMAALAEGVETEFPLPSRATIR